MQDAVYIHEKVEKIEPFSRWTITAYKVELNVTSIMKKLEWYKDLSFEECILLFLKVIDFPLKIVLRKRLKDGKIVSMMQYL